MADKKKTGVVSRNETSKELLSSTANIGKKQMSTDSKHLASATSISKDGTADQKDGSSSMA